MPHRVLSCLAGLILAAAPLALAQTTPPAADPAETFDVVLIHGLGANATVWDDVRSFLERSLAVSTYELHGHGTTPPLPHPTIAAEAAALGDWLTARGLRYPTLVGHGLGGMVALQYTLDHPTAVRRLILIDATPRQLTSVADEENIKAALLADYDRFVAGRFLAVSANEDIARAAVDMALRTDSTSLAGLLVSSFDWDVSQRLAGLTVPMLLVASANFLPEAGYERETLSTYGFQQARTLYFRKMPAAGHYLMLEQPDALAAMILVYVRQGEIR